MEFGWGSCSGCDALQAAGSWGEVAELRDKLANDIVWHDSADEMLKWWDARDWEVQWSYQPDDHKAFFAKARQALVDAVDNTNEQGG